MHIPLGLSVRCRFRPRDSDAPDRLGAREWEGDVVQCYSFFAKIAFVYKHDFLSLVKQTSDLTPRVLTTTVSDHSGIGSVE